MGGGRWVRVGWCIHWPLAAGRWLMSNSLALAASRKEDDDDDDDDQG
jgi:hypothetical protein